MRKISNFFASFSLGSKLLYFWKKSDHFCWPLWGSIGGRVCNRGTARLRHALWRWTCWPRVRFWPVLCGDPRHIAKISLWLSFLFCTVEVRALVFKLLSVVDPGSGTPSLLLQLQTRSLFLILFVPYQVRLSLDSRFVLALCADSLRYESIHVTVCLTLRNALCGH